MLFDTDVIVWALRGNQKAAACIDAEPSLALSAVSYMELLKGSRDKDDQRLTIAFIRDMGFQTLPIGENVSHRAIVYMEEFALSHGLDLADALIAATAAERKIAICTANDKHYKTIPGLTIARFRP
ncbi:MAG: PIN domain-containing protein [Verrucomicrobia bacterium]|jgi:predicted nucleic acid-binding protein|nr:PIN domain-containing protein [Verrucomicrobiota bacterium]MBT7066451.1 PIN domain-containing protein [Verrucomicrobiota bacterium]MBT7700643.1 PIN domain-containing protein [Verrucomicrobiota bacterium]